MGLACCKQAEYEPVGAQRKRWVLTSTESSDPLETVIGIRVLPYTDARRAQCLICLGDNVAPADVYAEWEDQHHAFSEWADAPEGIFGSMCACTPAASPKHLTCLATQLRKLGPTSRRTCGICDTPWHVFNYTPAGDDRDPWRWLEPFRETEDGAYETECTVGTFRMVVSAGPETGSLPKGQVGPQFDFYSHVDVWLYDDGELIVPQDHLDLRNSGSCRFFVGQPNGSAVPWHCVASLHNLLEVVSNNSAA